MDASGEGKTMGKSSRRAFFLGKKKNKKRASWIVQHPNTSVWGHSFLG